MSEEEQQPAMTEEEAQQIIERVRARFAALRGISLADELIADRRRETARDPHTDCRRSPAIS